MDMEDLLSFNYVNLDRLTETYSTSFYSHYMTRWPEYQRIALHPTTGIPMGYMISKAEGNNEEFHGHVSAVTVAPTFRRQGLGGELMKEMEMTSTFVHNAYFVDLFVRQSNELAISMYKKLGYVIYRRVLGYYDGMGEEDKEDALDMRHGLARHRHRSTSGLIPLPHPVKPQDLPFT